MSLAFAVNQQHVRNFHLSAAVHPLMYSLLRRAGVPVLSPGQREKGRIVLVPFPAERHGLLDEVLELGVDQTTQQLQAKVKRVDAVLYPAPGWPQRGQWNYAGEMGVFCEDAAALIQGQRCPFPHACVCSG